MEHPRILIQLDSDSHPSVFDSVVAIDSQVDHLLQYANVSPSNVRGLVHGAMFTRGPAQLKQTAIFIGGSNVAVGESIATTIRETFFGPVRVSVMLDGNGSNTTAVAAVLCAARHCDLSQMHAVVLGGTGPVGQRIARLLLRQGAKVALGSRQIERAEQVCDELRLRMTGTNSLGQLQPLATADTGKLTDTLEQATAVFSCGAAGVELLNAQQLNQAAQVQIAIDLNAVPPAGIAGISATDKAVVRGSRVDYGAIGVGGLKMKIHRSAINSLFTRNDLFLDAEEIFEIGQQLESSSQV